MDMGGVGKGSQPKDPIKPLTDVATKAAQNAKAGTIKSIKLKVKFDPKKKGSAS